MGKLKLVANVTLERLDDQIKWYSKSSKWNQNRFKWLKVVEVVAAALVPFFAGGGSYPAVTGLLGVVVVVLESL
jgi:Protein of unknown function (DUF4231)